MTRRGKGIIRENVYDGLERLKNVMDDDSSKGSEGIHRIQWTVVKMIAHSQSIRK